MQLRKYCPYDVGDYYITENAGNPSEKWAGTSWERVRGRVLIGEDDTISAGSTGGSATHAHTTQSHTLTADEMPTHAHAYHRIYGQGENTYHEWDDYHITYGRSQWPSVYAPLEETTATGGGKAHSHGDTGSASNLPPYLAVYMWKRVA